MAEEMFKTTLMGGFDKDDVQEKVQKMKDETAQQQLAFKKEIEEKEQRIAEWATSAAPPCGMHWAVWSRRA